MDEVCIHEVPLNQDCGKCPPVPSLANAARAYLAYQEEIAKDSFREWNGTEWVWNDDLWESSDPDEFNLVKALREALQYEWIRA